MNKSPTCPFSIFDKSSASSQSSTMGFENKPRKQANMEDMAPKRSQSRFNNDKSAFEASTTKLFGSELFSALKAWQMEQAKHSGAKRTAPNSITIGPHDNWTQPEERPSIMTAQVPPMPIRKKPPGPRLVYANAGDTESEGDDEQND